MGAELPNITLAQGYQQVPLNMIAARSLVAFAAMALVSSVVTECVFQSADTKRLESA
jgi:hypothetical protein